MNVIKQRQLSNGEKLTPKTDFVFSSGNNDIDNTIFNIDGSIKLDSAYNIDVDGNKIKSVGKGEVAMVDVSDRNYSWLKITSKDGNATNKREVAFDTYPVAHTDSTYYKTLDVFTFLGKPFVADGDNDRYIMINFLNETGKYYPALINIETMEVHTPSDKGYPVYHDFVFDGADRVYFVYSGSGDFSNRRIISVSITDFKSGIYNEESLEDNTGARIGANRIYGHTKNHLIYQTLSGGTARINMETKEVALVDIDTYNAVVFPDIEEHGNIESRKTDGSIWFLDRQNNFNHSLTSSLVSAGIITSGEQGVTPQLITDWKRTSEYIEFTLVFSRVPDGLTAGNFIYLGHAKMRINIATKEITILNHGQTRSNVEYVNHLRLNNGFSYSCNSYGVGKFYNYGLQKQWNNLTAEGGG